MPERPLHGGADALAVEGDVGPGRSRLIEHVPRTGGSR